MQKQICNMRFMIYPQKVSIQLKQIIISFLVLFDKFITKFMVLNAPICSSDGNDITRRRLNVVRPTTLVVGQRMVLATRGEKGDVSIP